jgi:hypothetical protein
VANSTYHEYSKIAWRIRAIKKFIVQQEVTFGQSDVNKFL